MNALEDPIFMKRVNKIIDLVGLKTGHDSEIKFMDDEGYQHKLEFILFDLGCSIWVGHTIFKKDIICVSEYWVVDVASKEWSHHCAHDNNTRKYRNQLMDRCSFNIDDVLNKLDLAIVDLI